MSKIKIVTDSASSIPSYFIEKLNIDVINIPVTRGNEEVDTTNLDYFYRLLDQGEIPTTSAPSPGEFHQFYERLSSENDTIISIHISGKVSATYHSACLARELLPDQDIIIVDSETISLATGFLVIAAARAALEGKTKSEMLALVEQLKPKVGGIIALPTLNFLAKSGRISQIKALMGNILSLKPILSIKDGGLVMTGKSRTFPNALNQMLTNMKKKYGNAKMKVAVVHTNAQEMAREYLDRVKQTLNFEETFIADLGPGLAVHGGPNMLGIVWMLIDQEHN